MNLRDEIVLYIHRAIDSSQEYEGEEKAQNRHSWEQITADRIIHAIIRGLPEPVDRKAKYEEFDGEGLSVQAGPDDEETMNYVCQFADDTGYNRYHKELIEMFSRLYRPVQDDVQSKYEEPRIYGASESSRSPDKEQNQGEEGLST